jgi:hypothetical protein
MAEEVVDSRAGTPPALTERQRLGVAVHDGRQAVLRLQPCEQREARQPGMFTGLTVTPPAVIGPAEPTPSADTPSGATCATAAVREANTASGSGTRAVGAVADRSSVPDASTMPAAIFVPPMSTARTVSTSVIAQPRTSRIS